ncbi:MAG: hypothetical protein IH946_00580 [Bacteroidetes bacterium]|nr:hypothetical protein [Bacteroidota bacterium]
MPSFLFIRLKLNISLLLIIQLLWSCGNDSSDLLPSPDLDETYVSGTLTSETVWNAKKSPYIVVGDVIVPREVTLTIEPGTEVRFDGFFSLIVQGKLNAVGTPNFPIQFRPHQSEPEIGTWKGIQFENTEDKNILQYVKVEYADVGIRSSFSSPQIMDSWIMNNRIGISLNLSSASIVHNLIQDNITGIDANIQLSAKLELLELVGNKIPKAERERIRKKYGNKTKIKF